MAASVKDHRIAGPGPRRPDCDTCAPKLSGSPLGEMLTDSARPDLARLANLLHKSGQGPVNLYAIHEKRWPDLLVLVVARDADLACDEIRDASLGLDWNTTMTVTRSIQRNVDATRCGDGISDCPSAQGADC